MNLATLARWQAICKACGFADRGELVAGSDQLFYLGYRE
jgi:hypothetical protein